MIGTGNQLLSDGTWTYSYDADGNMIEKTLGAGLQTWYYSYNAQNQLTEAIETSDGTTEVETVSYTYDADSATKSCRSSGPAALAPRSPSRSTTARPCSWTSTAAAPCRCILCRQWS